MTGASDIAELLELVRQHHQLTGSTIAAEVINGWDHFLPRFVKVMPLDYKRVLAERQVHDTEQGATLLGELKAREMIG